jgi:hypothetical protein
MKNPKPFCGMTIVRPPGKKKLCAIRRKPDGIGPTLRQEVALPARFERATCGLGKTAGLSAAITCN